MHTLARQCPMGRVPTSTPDLPEDVLALLDHHLLDLGGTYGGPNAGYLIPPVAVGVLHVNLAMAPSVYEARRSEGT